MLSALLLAACASGPHPTTGVASCYGAELAGRLTASGEPFDPAGLTAAHRTLPLGSLALVTSLDTGRAVVVRINDRGPYRGKRLIDLSRGAARLLGIDGLGRVRVEPAPRGARPGLLAGGTRRYGDARLIPIP